MPSATTYIPREVTDETKTPSVQLVLPLLRSMPKANANNNSLPLMLVSIINRVLKAAKFSVYSSIVQRMCFCMYRDLSGIRMAF